MDLVEKILVITGLVVFLPITLFFCMIYGFVKLIQEIVES